MIKTKYAFVAVDFDGTLCTDAFPGIGKPKPLVIRYVKRLAAAIEAEEERRGQK